MGPPSGHWMVYQVRVQVLAPRVGRYTWVAQSQIRTSALRNTGDPPSTRVGRSPGLSAGTLWGPRPPLTRRPHSPRQARSQSHRPTSLPASQSGKHGGPVATAGPSSGVGEGDGGWGRPRQPVQQTQRSISAKNNYTAFQLVCESRHESRVSCVLAGTSLT